MLGVQELIVILIIVVLLFGSKRIPEIMSGFGKGIKTFKKALDEDDTPRPAASPPNATPTAANPEQEPRRDPGDLNEKPTKD